MSVKKVIDKDKKLLMWRIYDDMVNEILLIIMEQGELRFYRPVDEEYE